MARITFFQLLFFLCVLSGFGQQLELKLTGVLPVCLEECSGIAVVPSGHIAMINDSGNDPAVFFSTLKGDIISSRLLPQISNEDWEDITYANGHLYIGDFGNNKNKRENLRIYKYKINGDDSLYDRSIIKFNFADQPAFPPNDANKDYDVEALVHAGDSIFMFTKNRSKPFDGYTYLYGMPDMPGSYALSRLDSFKTGIGIKDSFWVTAAALNQNTNTLALLGNDKIWVFRDFRDHDFFGGRLTVFAFDKLTQKESVGFLNDTTLIITDELNKRGGGNIYTGFLPMKNTAKNKVQVVPKQFTDSIALTFDKGTAEPIYWEIFNTSGERPLSGTIKKMPGNGEVILDVSSLDAGGYVLNIIINGNPHAFKLKKLLSIKRSN